LSLLFNKRERILPLQGRVLHRIQSRGGSNPVPTHSPGFSLGLATETKILIISLHIYLF
jgi:hypothetical protein